MWRVVVAMWYSLGYPPLQTTLLQFHFQTSLEAVTLLPCICDYNFLAEWV